MVPCDEDGVNQMTKWPLVFTDIAIAHDLLAERESTTGRGTGTGGGTPGLAVEAGIEGGGPVPGPALVSVSMPTPGEVGGRRNLLSQLHRM